jgi:hypothetical protein
MKVVSLDRITKRKADMEGAKDVQKQIPLGRSDGTPAYSFRVIPAVTPPTTNTPTST